ncbi:hypothetical protein A2U01_0113071, partial [Trifolium medium]|nr:hypothetical protein [Trifolium medium]
MGEENEDMPKQTEQVVMDQSDSQNNRVVPT